MDKFSARELEIFNLIKQGESRNSIYTKIETTIACVNSALCQIYNKTENIVNYRSQRNKFEELQMFLRNNPTAFTPIPAGPVENKTDLQPIPTGAKAHKNIENSIEIKFQLFQDVRIKILENIKGRVISVWLTAKGLKYEVRYFWNCESKEVYFYEDELEAINV